MSLNKVFLLGAITRALELRYTPGGMAVGTLTVASARSYTYKGEQRHETATVPITVFGAQAEALGELPLAATVLVEGRLQSREWKGRDGQARTSIEVVADRVQVLGGARDPAEGEPDSRYRETESPRPPRGAPAAEPDGLPF